MFMSTLDNEVLTRVYYACLDRIESDSVKYGALLDYLDPYTN